MPHFSCYYPGTTHDDYLDILNADSCGREIRHYFYRRPYVMLPIGSY